MCDIKEGFKLCTCNKVDETKTHWKLIRFEDGMNIVIGEVEEAFHVQLMSYDWVKTELNTRNCFDFEYTPIDGDRLIIELKKEEDLTLCFDYSDFGYKSAWRQNLIFDNSDATLLHTGYSDSEN